MFIAVWMTLPMDGWATRYEITVAMFLYNLALIYGLYFFIVFIQTLLHYFIMDFYVILIFLSCWGCLSVMLILISFHPHSVAYKFIFD
jgi:hypothetical protein